MSSDIPKRGRPAEFVRDANDREVHGLSATEVKDDKKKTVRYRYYATFSEPRKWFGFDRDLAIMRFRAWESARTRKQVVIKDQMESLLELDDLDKLAQRFIDFEKGEHVIDTDGTIYSELPVPAHQFWKTARSLVLKDPIEAARNIGIPEIAHLDHLKPPPPSMSLEAIGKLYQEDKKSLTGKEHKNSTKWWDEFCAVTKATKVSDLNRDMFRKYRKHVTDECARLGRAPAYIRSRFGKVKTVINYAIHEADLCPNDRAILELRALLRPPPQAAPNPIDMTVEEVRAMLKHADPWEKALILTGLNCAYNPIDIRRLQWTMIDFNKKVIRFDRTKSIGRTQKPVPRVAVLWTSTCDALQAIRNDHTHVFLSEYKIPVGYDTISRRWQEVCDKAKVTRHLTPGHMRDTALTVAASSADPVVPMQQYHVLAGHVAKGVDDNYIRRFPRFVEAACEAIRKYFGL